MGIHLALNSHISEREPLQMTNPNFYQLQHLNL